MALNIEFVQGGAVRASLTVRARLVGGAQEGGGLLARVRQVPVELERLADGRVQPRDHELVTADVGKHVEGAQAGAGGA
jgi:hypothetical protein